MRVSDYGDDMNKVVARRIFRLRHERGETQAEFGKSLGVTQGSVSRWEKGSIPDSEAAAHLAAMAGVSVTEFLGLPPIEGVMLTGETIEVRGSVAAGVWAEAYEWPEEKRFGFTGSPNITHIKAPHRFGLQVEGESMNLRYPPGTLLDCVSVYALDSEPVNGQRIIVERYSADGKVEATVKQLVVSDDGKHWLVAESSHPEFQAPILIDRDDPAMETRVIAVVVGSYRPE